MATEKLAIVDAINKWLGILGMPQNGIFNLPVDVATRTWQVQHNIFPDGAVGVASWKAALGEKYEPPLHPTISINGAIYPEEFPQGKPVPAIPVKTLWYLAGAAVGIILLGMILERRGPVPERGRFY